MIVGPGDEETMYLFAAPSAERGRHSFRGLTRPKSQKQHYIFTFMEVLAEARLLKEIYGESNSLLLSPACVYMPQLIMRSLSWEQAVPFYLPRALLTA